MKITIYAKKKGILMLNIYYGDMKETVYNTSAYFKYDYEDIKTEEFAGEIQKTDNYYVIVTRESLPTLPYSVEEIYGIRTSGNIFFIDEENSFINTEEFASMVKESDNYFVLITRENLYNLPYSVDEIYGLHESGKYHDTRKVYQQMYHIYSIEEKFVLLPMELRLVQK